MTRLTRTTVAAAAKRDKPWKLFDETLKGFGLLVRPNGKKAFILEYRPVGTGRGTPKKRIKIGDSAVLTADEARGVAKDLLAGIRKGGDPASAHAKQRATPTFAEFVETHLAAEKSRLKRSTHALYGIYLRTHAGPALGTMKLNAVTRADIRKLNQTIGAVKKVTANRVLKAISGLYRHAVDIGALPEGFGNPTAGIKPYREEGRERFLNNDELEALGKAMRELQPSDPIGVAP